MQRGLNPNGSLAPTNFLGLITTNENAPLIFLIARPTASSTVLLFKRSLAM